MAKAKYPVHERIPVYDCPSITVSKTVFASPDHVIVGVFVELKYPSGNSMISGDNGAVVSSEKFKRAGKLSFPAASERINAATYESSVKLFVDMSICQVDETDPFIV